MYLYENCEYWQNNGHTTRHSHKFHRMLIVIYKLYRVNTILKSYHIFHILYIFHH